MDKQTTTFSIRIPLELHNQLKEIAEEDSRSINSLILKYIKDGVKNDSKQK